MNAPSNRAQANSRDTPARNTPPPASPPAGPPAARPDRSERTRAALIEAARRVFAEVGYFNAEIAQITRAADRATGTFYVHFDSKQQLLMAMVDEFTRDLIASGLDRPEHPPEAAPMVLRTLWTTHHRHSATFRALVEAASTHPDMAATYAGLRQNARRDFESMLRSAPNWRTAADEDIVLTAAALEMMVTASLYEWHALNQQPDGYSEERGFDTVLAILTGTLTRAR
jgi:AcrR family transcriptional regulator